MSDGTTTFVSCNRDCGGGCALIAEVEDGRVTRVRDSQLRPEYMRGCIKGYRSAETLYHPDRLTEPLIRTGLRGSGEFRTASWDEALDLVADKLRQLGADGRWGDVLKLGGSGSCRGMLHNSSLTTARFLSLWGGYTGTTGGYSSHATDYVKGPMFGTRHIGVDARTLLHSEYIILWGFNPFDSRFDSEVEEVLKEAVRRGIAVTVIDPRKTRTVTELGANWIPVKPGTDSAFMLAVLWVLINEGLVDRDALEKYATGFDLYEAYITGADGGQPKTPAWAEAICGYPAEEIVAFARRYGGGELTALLPGLSLQRAIGGENADRIGAVLQLATGNAGKLGGSTGSAKWNRLPKPRIGSLPVPANPLGLGVPVNRWPDAVIESDISFIYNVGGNYIGQGSDTAKSIKAFEAVDFAVTHDYFLTDTARYCDVVLPVTTYLERGDIVTANNNYLFYSAKAVEPLGGARNDFDIFSDLAERLGFGDNYTEGRTESEWLEHFLDQSEITDREEFLRTGYYTGADRKRIGLAEFFADPDAHPLSTESGKIEITSPAIQADGGTLLPEHELLATTADFPLRMITPHERYRVHSQNDNIPSLKKLCDDRLWIHTEDAAERGISDGDPVAVTSPDGHIDVEAFVTDQICPGSVSLNQGVWAMAANGGANANWLTSTESTVPAGATRTHSIIVQVTRG